MKNYMDIKSVRENAGNNVSSDPQQPSIALRMMNNNNPINNY